MGRGSCYRDSEPRSRFAALAERGKDKNAVISNCDYSGNLLQEKLNKIFPENQFEFVIASSDYGVMKPNRYIFQAGIVKSGLEAKDIWYVGDKVELGEK